MKHEFMGSAQDPARIYKAIQAYTRLPRKKFMRPTPRLNPLERSETARDHDFWGRPFYRPGAFKSRFAPKKSLKHTRLPAIILIGMQKP
jgi:hypothetical protein